MQIKLLDCTLRDGGYINNWEFGEGVIDDISNKLSNAGIDIIELGFIKDESYDKKRCVFSDICRTQEFIKDKNKLYAVMAEVVNPLPLDKLEPYREGLPQIIRVIVWKKMLKEGFEYCRGIVQKGYRLCVQPARVSQYDDIEFVDMIKTFSELNPMAIYIVDSWGTMYKEDLVHYLKLADENLKEGILIGYHGHNNLMQAFNTAEAFIKANSKRDLIIDSSVYGMGRGAGNLNTEVIAKFLNENCGKSYKVEPLIQIFDKYLSDIYKKEKWGYSIPYFISAKYNANPDFARYYKKSGVSDEIIEKCIKAIPKEERIIFSETTALNTLYKIRKETYKFCIIVPTCNRINAVRYWLDNKAKEFFEYGIDLIFLDSSDNDDTKNIIEKYKFQNVFYEKYDNKQIYPNDLDEKFVYSLKSTSDKYNIIWPCRDRSFPVIKNVYKNIIKAFENKKDFIVVYPHQTEEAKVIEKNYDSCIELAYKMFGEMTSLGSIIYSSGFAKRLVYNQPVKRGINLGLWGPVSVFHEIVNGFSAFYIKTEAFEYMPYSASFWMKNKSAFNLWVKSWPLMVENLPDEYNSIKYDILTFKNWTLSPFNPTLLLYYRLYGDFIPFDVLKNRRIINKMLKGRFYRMFFISLFPNFVIKSALENKNKTIKKIFFLPVKIGDIIYGIFDNKYDYGEKKLSRQKDIINYESKTNCFKNTENIESVCLIDNKKSIDNPLITVFIPCYKRYDYFIQAVESVLNQEPVDFKWDITVVDNERYDGTPNKIQKYIEKLNNKRITYYRNKETLEVADNFNRGILLSRAPWVMMLHDDDLLVSNALYKMGKAIEFLLSKKGKPLGAVCASGYQFKYDPNNIEASNELVRKMNKLFSQKPMSYKFYKQTHFSPLFTGHIGGSAPTNGSTYNREALISIGGFNSKHGIMADLIANYCLENNYSVYLTSEPYGLYRWGENQSTEYKTSYQIIENGYLFREYMFSKNIFTRLWGILFRRFLHRYFLENVINMRKTASNEYLLAADYASIYNKKPQGLIFKLWRRLVPKTYNKVKYIKSKILSFEAEKYFKNKEQNICKQYQKN